MTDDNARSTARVLVSLYCIAFLTFGAAALLFPAQLARLVDIPLNTPSALADLRAVYGGLSLAVAALFWQGLRNPAWSAPVLFLAMGCSLGPASARIYSIAVSGSPSGLVMAELVIELVSFAFALRAYRALHSDASAQPLGAARTAG